MRNDPVFTPPQKIRLRELDAQIDLLVQKKNQARTPESVKFYEIAIRDLRKAATKIAEEFYRKQGGNALF